MFELEMYISYLKKWLNITKPWQSLYIQGCVILFDINIMNKIKNTHSKSMTSVFSVIEIKKTGRSTIGRYTLVVFMSVWY